MRSQACATASEGYNYLLPVQAGEMLLREHVMIHLAHAGDKLNALLSMTAKLFSLAAGLCTDDNADALSHHEALLPGALLSKFMADKLAECLALFKRQASSHRPYLLAFLGATLRLWGATWNYGGGFRLLQQAVFEQAQRVLLVRPLMQFLSATRQKVLPDGTSSYCISIPCYNILIFFLIGLQMSSLFLQLLLSVRVCKLALACKESKVSLDRMHGKHDYLPSSRPNRCCKIMRKSLRRSTSATLSMSRRPRTACQMSARRYACEDIQPSFSRSSCEHHLVVRARLSWCAW